MNKDEIDISKIGQSHLFILGGPHDLFTNEEFNAMKDYLYNGRSILLMLNDTMSENSIKNIN